MSAYLDARGDLWVESTQEQVDELGAVVQELASVENDPDADLATLRAALDRARALLAWLNVAGTIVDEPKGIN
jgi:hypothetical protein